MPRFLTAAACLALAACSTEDGTPVTWPAAGFFNPSADDQQRRAAVELFVKTNHPALVADIAAGGGPTLERAFDIANVPAGDRPARRLQLRGDLDAYATAPGALVVALNLYGG